MVTPNTVVRWHRLGFRYYWRWKSKGKPGRPPISRTLIALIQRMARENPTWGAPHIQPELKLLGYDLAESTVGDYLTKIRPHRPKGQSWQTFLRNHLPAFAAADFFQVFTLNGAILYGLIVLAHDRKTILCLAVTKRPTAARTAEQLQRALQDQPGIRYLLHDRDPVFNRLLQERLEQLGIEDKKTAPRSPWQNPYVERWIGGLRRDLLDHVIVLNERHLLRLLQRYAAYFQHDRTHLSLDRNAPIPRQVEPPEDGELVALPRLGGLHHRYTRRSQAA